MKYTEIDGKRYEIKSCDECPMRKEIREIYDRELTYDA